MSCWGVFADWTICPFAHAGEKAVRRDPRTVEYTGIACPDMKKNASCIRGDRCPYAHNVFEYWLHPTRYRTQLCNDGPGCRRSICFFAHSLDELRVPANKPYVSPEALARASIEAIQNNPHPLGAQIAPRTSDAPLASKAGYSNDPSPFNSDAYAMHQQAALAALGPPARSPTDLNAMDMRLQEGIPYTHISPHPPRLSSDYGSLPRWSNNFGPNQHITRSSLGSMPGTPSFQGFQQRVVRASAPPISSSSSSGSEEDSGTAGFDKTVQNPFPRAVQENSNSEGGTEHTLQATGTKTAREGVPGETSDILATLNGLLPSGTSLQDDQLAQSLANLKIALTQQSAPQATASNHDLVIGTLHQILRDAVEHQRRATSMEMNVAAGAEALREVPQDRSRFQAQGALGMPSPDMNPGPVRDMMQRNHSTGSTSETTTDPRQVTPRSSLEGMAGFPNVPFSDLYSPLGSVPSQLGAE